MHLSRFQSILILLVGAGCADPRVVVFGATPGLLEVTNINPGCEEVTAGAEFSSTFLVSVNGSTVETPLLELLGEPFEEAAPREFALDLEVPASVGATICVSSSGTEEDDDFVDDPLSDDSKCVVLEEDDTTYTFDLSMAADDCTMTAVFEAVVE